jgi:hypothetical protein
VRATLRNRLQPLFGERRRNQAAKTMQENVKRVKIENYRAEPDKQIGRHQDRREEEDKTNSLQVGMKIMNEVSGATCRLEQIFEYC